MRLFHRKRRGEKESGEIVSWYRRVDSEVKRWSEMRDEWEGDGVFERKEVEKELRGMRDGAGGADGITVRFLKEGGERAVDLVEGIVEWVRFWEVGPDFLKKEVIVPVYKRGKKVVGKELYTSNTADSSDEVDTETGLQEG